MSSWFLFGLIAVFIVGAGYAVLQLDIFKDEKDSDMDDSTG